MKCARNNVSSGFSLAALLACVALPAWSQGFPSKPIHFVTGNAPGTQADIMLRLLGPELTKRGGVPVIVENRAGASGTIGAQAVARAVPDGYTLLFTGTSIEPIFVKNNAVEVTRQLAPVSNISKSVYFLYANAKLPFKTLAEVVANVL